MIRHRLNAKEREALWRREAEKAREVGRGDHPICVHCSFPILPGRGWDATHDPQIPNWLRPRLPDSCGHEKCNRRHNNTHDTPLFAKNERIRKRFMDFHRSRTPLPGGRDDRVKKKISGQVVVR